MISYIKGNVVYKDDNFIIVETGGIGYKIFVSPTTMAGISEIDEEKQIKIYTFMNVKEDSISLFGFETMSELDMFNKLITVSGVGPKAALSILNYLKPSEIVMAVLSSDDSVLSKAQGIGKKTAQRIILELKDKFKNSDLTIDDKGEKIDANTKNESKTEAIQALTSLGYTLTEAIRAVSAVYEDKLSTQQILKLSLKKLAGQ